MTNTTTATEADRWKHRDQADRAMYLDVTIQGLTAEWVEIRPSKAHPGVATVTLGGNRVRATFIDTLETLRAVVDELDRQLTIIEAKRSGS